MKYCKSPLCSLKCEVYFGVLFVGVQSSSSRLIDLKNKPYNQPMTAHRACTLQVVFTTYIILAAFLPCCAVDRGDGRGAHSCQGDW